MKKYLLLLLFIPLAFSCSSDDSGDSNQSENENFNNYPKLISYTREKPNLCDGIEWFSEFSYSGDKIISYSNTVYYHYFGGECNYYGDEGYINNTVNNVYSGDLLVSQNIITYSPDGSQNNSYLLLYEYDDDGFINKMTREVSNNGGVSSDETMYFWTNNNLTRQATNSNGLIIEVRNYDSNYNCLEANFYENGQIVQTRSYTYDMTKYNNLANANKYWVWNGAGPRNHNLIVSQSIINISDDTEVEISYENTNNEYGFPTYVFSDKSDNSSLSWPRIYTFNYE